MSIVERVARAMYETPHDYDGVSGSFVWPPRHPEDLAWWMTRAQAAVGVLDEVAEETK